MMKTIKFYHQKIGKWLVNCLLESYLGTSIIIIMLKFSLTILLSSAQNYYLLFPQSYLLFTVLLSKFGTFNDELTSKKRCQASCLDQCALRVNQSVVNCT